MATTTTTLRSIFDGKNYTTRLISDDHEILGDEPLEEGGQNKGMDPFELVLAGLATCTSATMKMYADRKGWPIEEIKIDLSIEDTNGPRPIKRVITVKGDLDEEQLQRLHIIAEKCPVHKLLSAGNPIETTLSK